jgi:type II secretory pathway predicted ATPase ExeA
MVDERGTTPVLVVDEAHLLSDKFLLDLSGFLNFAFDSRDLLCLWLVGLPTLRRTLQMHQHDALAMRLGAQVHFEPTTDREAFISAINACLDGVGARSKLLSDPAYEILFRASRGVFRVAAKLLRGALRAAPRARPGFRRRADHGNPPSTRSSPSPPPNRPRRPDSHGLTASHPPRG